MLSSSCSAPRSVLWPFSFSCCCCCRLSGPGPCLISTKFSHQITNQLSSHRVTRQIISQDPRWLPNLLSAHPATRDLHTYISRLPSLLYLPSHGQPPLPNLCSAFALPGTLVAPHLGLSRQKSACPRRHFDARDQNGHGHV